MTMSPSTHRSGQRRRWNTLLLDLLITLTGLPGLGATPALALAADPLDIPQIVEAHALTGSPQLFEVRGQTSSGVVAAAWRPGH